MSRPAHLLGLSALIIGLSHASGSAPAAPSGGERDLEVRVWTADELDLPQIEHEVAHLLQAEAHSVQAHQLLSHVFVRQFTRDPSDLYLLRQAADLAQQAVDLEPQNPRGYAALADILDLMGNADRGLKLLTEAEAKGVASNWRFAFTRARLMADKAALGSILAELRHALKMPHNEPRIIVPYVVALLQTEATGRDLVASLKEWNQQYPSPLFALASGVALTDLGEFQQAHAVYRQVLASSPHDKEAMVNDGIVLYRDLKDSKQGIALLRQALAEHGADLSAEARSMIAAHLGAALIQQKKWDEARTMYLTALTAAPGNLSLIDFMARAYRGAKQPTQLVATLQLLNDNVPGTSVLHALLGETLSEQLNRHEAAVQAFADALVLDPDRSDYYNGMGLALYRNKSYPEALKAFAYATEVDPNDATARYNQACVLAVVGRSEEALTFLAEAISIDPRLMQTAKTDSDFANLKSSARFHTLVQDAGPSDESQIAH